MSNYYAPCFYRIGFVVIPSYIERPCFDCPEDSDLYSSKSLGKHWFRNYVYSISSKKDNETKSFSKVERLD